MGTLPLLWPRGPTRGAGEETTFLWGAWGTGIHAGAMAGRPQCRWVDRGGIAGHAAVRAPETPPLLLSLPIPGHLSEDPKFPKVPWPTPDLCPACHEEIKGLHSWNEDQVLLFLKRHYGGDNLVDTYAVDQGDTGEGGGPPQGREPERGLASPEKPRGDQRAESLRPPRALPPGPRLSDGSQLGLDGRLQSPSGAEGRREVEAAVPFLGMGFSSLDMSLCVVLYVASSLFLMVMYFFFRVRSKRWKVRHHRPSV